MFETGAISKNIDKSKVVPILFGIEPSELKGPLVQFQAAKFEKTEMKRIVQMINNELGESKLASDVLDSVFEMWWPKLEEQVKFILEKTETEETRDLRSERDLLEEILITVRSQARRSNLININPAAVKDLVKNSIKLINSITELGFIEDVLPIIAELYKPIEYIVRRYEVMMEPFDNEVKKLFDAISYTIEELSGTSTIEENEPKMIKIIKKRRRESNE